MISAISPQIIVAPISRQVLRPIEQPSGTCLVSEEQPHKSFPVLLGIPLLLPPGYVADWDHNVLEVVLGDNAHSVVAEAIRQFGQNTAATDAVSIRIADTMGPNGVREAIREYAKLPPSARLKWWPYYSASTDMRTTLVDDDTLRRARRYATRENGLKRLTQARESAEKWGFHLPLFRHLIRAADAGAVVELGCGAGAGTCAILDGIGDQPHLFPLDVDFACTANCLGIGKAVQGADRLHPIVASFWHLPFPDASVDLVCSHYGIDETREVTAVLREVARVLRPGGSLISVSKTNPSDRMKTYLGRLGLTNEELTKMAQETDLYGGPDHFSACTADCGLHMVDAYSMHGLRSHDRTLFHLRKD